VSYTADGNQKTFSLLILSSILSSYFEMRNRGSGSTSVDRGSPHANSISPHRWTPSSLYALRTPYFICQHQASPGTDRHVWSVVVVVSPSDAWTRMMGPHQYASRPAVSDVAEAVFCKLQYCIPYCAPYCTPYCIPYCIPYMYVSRKLRPMKHPTSLPPSSSALSLYSLYP
jgi:hypothetical protein